MALQKEAAPMLAANRRGLHHTRPRSRGATCDDWVKAKGLGLVSRRWEKLFISSI